jgi:hypothetical protein
MHIFNGAYSHYDCTIELVVFAFIILDETVQDLDQIAFLKSPRT